MTKKYNTSVYKINADGSQTLVNTSSKSYPLDNINRPLTQGEKNEYFNSLPINSLIKRLLKPIPPVLGVSKSISDFTEKINKSLEVLKPNPTLLRITELRVNIERGLKHLENEQVKAKGNIWHELTEQELQATRKENEGLRQLLEEYEARLKYADYIVSTRHINPSKDTETTPLTLNPRFNDKPYSIGILVSKLNHIFKASEKHWENLFSSDIKQFDKSIKLCNGVPLTDLRFFIDELSREFINGNVLTVLEKCQAFEYQGSPVTSRQLTEALQTLKQCQPPHKEDSLCSLFATSVT